MSLRLARNLTGLFQPVDFARGKIREQRDDQDAHDWDGGLEPYRRLL